MDEIRESDVTNAPEAAPAEGEAAPAEQAEQAASDVNTDVSQPEAGAEAAAE